MPVRPPLAIAAAVLTFSILAASIGCKKVQHENPASGSLYSADGNCFVDAPSGTYFTGIASDSNYVLASVHVSSPGSYNITTDKQNGVIFSASGTFTDTGKTSVKLRATGTFIKPVLTYFQPHLRHYHVSVLGPGRGQHRAFYDPRFMEIHRRRTHLSGYWHRSMV